MNEDIDDSIRSMKSLENSGLLNYEGSETVKHETKRQEGGFLGSILFGTLGTSWEQEEDIIWIIWIKIVSSIPSFKQYQDP